MSCIVWILLGVIGARYYAKRKDRSQAPGPDAIISDSTRPTQPQASSETLVEVDNRPPGWFKATREERAVMADDLSKIAGETVTEFSVAVLGVVNNATTRIANCREQRRQQRLIPTTAVPQAVQSPAPAPPSDGTNVLPEKAGPLV